MGAQFRADVVYAVAIEKKYSGYMARAKEETEKMTRQNQKRIDWHALVASKNISHECKLRIERIRPETFGQLRKIEGIRPATLAYVAGNAL